MREVLRTLLGNSPKDRSKVNTGKSTSPAAGHQNREKSMGVADASLCPNWRAPLTVAGAVREGGSVPCHAGQARRWPLAQADDNQGLTRGGDPKQVSSFHLSLGSERWCWKCRRSSQFDHMRRPQSAEPSRTLFAADVGIRPARAEYLGESHLSEAAPSMRTATVFGTHVYISTAPRQEPQSQP
jgi:hypothetical protein